MFYKNVALGNTWQINAKRMKDPQKYFLLAKAAQL